MGFLSGRHDDALSATGLAKIVQATARPDIEWTSSYAHGAVKEREGVDLPFGHATLQLRVTPDGGGAEFASEATVKHGDQEHLDARHLTYVRYDPAHPEQCVIDCDRLEREFGPVQGAGHAKRNTVPAWVAQEWAKQAAGGDQPAPAGEPDQPSAPATPAGTDLADEFSKLSQLHASGVLSDDEFAQAKARLLNG